MRLRQMSLCLLRVLLREREPLQEQVREPLQEQEQVRRRGQEQRLR